MIRPATLDDIPAMLDMGRRFFDASGYDDVTEFDDESAHNTFAMLINSPDGVVLVADDGGKVCGTAAALCFPFFFNTKHRHSQEFFWWVNDEARQSGVGIRLMRALQDGVAKKGAKSIEMAAVASLRPDAVAEIYRRDGFRPSGLTFVKGL